MLRLGFLLMFVGLLILCFQFSQFVFQGVLVQNVFPGVGLFLGGNWLRVWAIGNKLKVLSDDDSNRKRRQAN